MIVLPIRMSSLMYYSEGEALNVFDLTFNIVNPLDLGWIVGSSVHYTLDIFTIQEAIDG